MRVVLVISEDDSLAAGLRAAIEGSHLVLSEPSLFDATAQLRLLDADLLVVDAPERHPPEALAALRDAADAALKAALCRVPSPGLNTVGWDLLLDNPDVDTAVPRLLVLLAGPPEPEPVTEAPEPTPGPSGQSSRSALRWVPRLARAADSPERLAETLADAVSDVLDASRVAVLLPGPSGLRVAAALDMPGPVREGVRLGPDSALVRRMLENPGLCGADAADPEVRRELSLLGMRLAVPLPWDGPLPGLVTAGALPGDRTPTADDTDALLALARTAGALRALVARTPRAEPTPPPMAAVSPASAPPPARRADRDDTAVWEHLAERVAEGVKDPLVVINTYAQLLPERGDDPAFRATCSDATRREVARINALVETLFEFARHPRLVPQQADLNETVRGILASFGEELAARAIQVETRLDPASPRTELDPIYFAQALHHVVRNAVEAMPSGGVLEVSTVTGPGGCEVRVADSGPGVPEEAGDSIFMPFYTTKENAAGLGLAVAERIARQHAGALDLVQNGGPGGVFAFRLPLTGLPHGDDPGH
jgi:two-component sensor histidine kinase